MSQSEPGNREAALTAALRALAEDDAKSGASSAVESRLLEEVRAIAAAAKVGDAESVENAEGTESTERVERARTMAARMRRRRVAASVVFAIAAALVLFVLGSSWRSRHPVRPSQTSIVTERGAVRAAPPVETATAFLPLIYSNVPITNGQVVRMEVPRTALASFGLASIDVRDGASAGTVLADVLVGEDGLARAVRFVRAAAATRQKE